MTPPTETIPLPQLRATLTSALEDAVADLDESVAAVSRAVRERSDDVRRRTAAGDDPRMLQFSKDMLEDLARSLVDVTAENLHARAYLRWWTGGGTVGTTREARS